MLYKDIEYRPDYNIIKVYDDDGKLEFIYSLQKSFNTDEKMINEAKRLYEKQLNHTASISELREKAYNEEGVTRDEMIVALWELVVEKRPEMAKELQVKREAVKQKYPKG